MSKNKYALPFKGKWYVEFGGIKESDRHDPYNINQRYAYDLEIRFNDLPYHDDYKKIENYYSYLQEIYAPCDGVIIDIVDKYEDTHIDENRKIICDVDDVRGNYIVIKHKYNEFSYIEHIKKGTFKVNFGEQVKQGQILAKVGNSGNSNGPHIHFHVQDRLEYFSGIGIPITFKNINIYRKKDNKKRRISTSYINKTNTVENKGI